MNYHQETQAGHSSEMRELERQRIMADWLLWMNPEGKALNFLS